MKLPEVSDPDLLAVAPKEMSTLTGHDDRILNALPANVAQVAQATGLDRDLVRSRLKALIEQGHAMRHGRGRGVYYDKALGAL